MKNFVSHLYLFSLIAFLFFPGVAFAEEVGEQNGEHELRWSHLPEEMQTHIFEYLSPTELIQSAQVNSVWRRLSKDTWLRKRRTRNTELAKLGIQVVSLPGGTFLIGSPEEEVGRHPDEIQRLENLSPFEVMDTHLTRAQAKALGVQPDFTRCDINGEERQNWDLFPNYPITCISWDDVTQKIIPAFKQIGIHARLMTEAEAEYLARLNGDERVITQSRYPWGDESKHLSKYAWWGLNSGRKVRNVRSTPETSSDGLYDTRGNVSSWVEDEYFDPGHPDLDKNKRVIRGGAFRFLFPRAFRSAYRFKAFPWERSETVSVRLVIE